MNLSTADLCDQLGPSARVCLGDWRSYGGRAAFAGPVQTVQTFEDAGLIRQALDEPGRGRVLVVEAGGSLRVAVLGDRLAGLGLRNGWAGVLIHGAVRDTRALGALDFGVVALGRVPNRGAMTGAGSAGKPITLGGVNIEPGDFIAVDEDGVVVTLLAYATNFLGHEVGAS
jgi:regulator of ribonuclease activity A